MSTVTSPVSLTAGLRAATVFLAVSACAAPAWAGNCGWIDADDPAAPGNDLGRGRLDVNAHKEFAIAESGRPNGATLIGDRMQTLFLCLDRAAYAKAYADASVLTAAAGRKYAGWKDGTDAKAPPGDSGRGISSHPAHLNYGLGPGGPTSATLLSARVASLAPLLQSPQWADLYGAISVMLARAGGSKPAPPPPPPVKAAIYYCDASATFSDDKATFGMKIELRLPATAAELGSLNGNFTAPEGTGQIMGKVATGGVTLVASVFSADKKSGWSRTLTGKGGLDNARQRLAVSGTMVNARTVNGNPAPTQANGTFNLNGPCTVAK